MSSSLGRNVHTNHKSDDVQSRRMCVSELANLAVLDAVSLSHKRVWCDAYNCLQHAGSDVDVSEMSVE